MKTLTNASKAIYRVGPSVPVTVPPETPVAPAESAPEQTQPAEPVTGVDGGPGVSPKPAETQPAGTESAGQSSGAGGPAETAPVPAENRSRAYRGGFRAGCTCGNPSRGTGDPGSAPGDSCGAGGRGMRNAGRPGGF